MIKYRPICDKSMHKVSKNNFLYKANDQEISGFFFPLAVYKFDRKILQI